MTNEIRKVFQRNLTSLMESRALSQVDLAKALNVSNTTVNNWVLGYNVPKMDRIDEICRVLQVTRIDFLGVEGEYYDIGSAESVTLVTNNPDRDWVYKKLPDMTDKQVRLMRKFYETIDEELERE